MFLYWGEAKGMTTCVWKDQLHTQNCRCCLPRDTPARTNQCLASKHWVPLGGQTFNFLSFAALILNSRWWSFWRHSLPTEVWGGICSLLCHTWLFIPGGYSADPWHLILDSGNADIWAFVLDLWHWVSIRKITGTWSAWLQLLDIWWCSPLWHVYHWK